MKILLLQRKQILPFCIYLRKWFLCTEIIWNLPTADHHHASVCGSLSSVWPLWIFMLWLQVLTRPRGLNSREFRRVWLQFRSSWLSVVALWSLNVLNLNSELTFIIFPVTLIMKWKAWTHLVIYCFYCVIIGCH